MGQVPELQAFANVFYDLGINCFIISDMAFKNILYLSSSEIIEDILNGETGNIAYCINSIIRETEYKQEASRTSIFNFIIKKNTELTVIHFNPATLLHMN